MVESNYIKTVLNKVGKNFKDRLFNTFIPNKNKKWLPSTA